MVNFIEKLVELVLFGMKFSYGFIQIVDGIELVLVVIVSYGFGVGDGGMQVDFDVFGSGGGGGGLLILVGVYIGGLDGLWFCLNLIVVMVVVILLVWVMGKVFVCIFKVVC